MKHVNQIYQNLKYQAHLRKIEEYETDRIFCLHNISHFMDVARIGHIMNLEAGMKINKELIYGFALLHDIGRWCQYENGESHETASVRLAEEILDETDYSSQDRKQILDAIGSHRLKETKSDSGFNGLMYRADKASRACYNCKARKECHWPEEKKNLTIEI